MSFRPSPKVQLRLHTAYLKLVRIPALQITLEYRASRMDCGGCLMKDRCCPSMQFRKVVRSIDEAACNEARRIAASPEYKQSYMDTARFAKLIVCDA